MLPSRVHPGVHLKELLQERSLSQSQLARHIKVKVGVINEVCNGKRGISVKLAQRLAAAFGSSAEFWLHLQLAYELGKSKTPIKVRKIVGSRVA